MPYAADRIRNVALVGHRGSGKTSLHEALLFEAGATTRLGSVADGTTVSDADEDEKSRGMSISASLASFEWRDTKVNLIDTPGEPSFIADSLGALRVCESAIFVVNGVMGVEVSTRRLWERAQELGVARLIYVNMLDRERADFFRALDSLKDAFGPHAVATEIPIGSEHEIARRDRPRRHEGLRVRRHGECTEIPIPDDLADQAQEYREKLMDEVAENSEALMERYLEGEEISHDEIVTALEDGTDHGAHLPGHLRRGHEPAGRQPPAGRDRRRPPVARSSTAARSTSTGTCSSPTPARRCSPTSSRRGADPFAGPDQPLPGLPGHDDPRHAGAQHPRPQQGAGGPAAEPARQGGHARRRVRPGRHRRGGQAQGDPRGRLAGGARHADPHAVDQAPRPGHGVRHRAEEQGRRGQGLHRRCAGCRRRTRRSTCTATTRRASRSWPGCRRSTSR